MDSADLILFNAKAITVDSANTIAEAVAIKDGKIAMVGTSSDVRSSSARPSAGEKCVEIDLEGKTVVPGFIDSHVHMDTTSAFTKLAVNCHIPDVEYVEVTGTVSSCTDILEAIKNRVNSTPVGEWIVGQGRFSLKTDGNSPSREQLDEISPDHPVVIRYSGHDQIYNSRALKTMDITRDGPSEEELEKLGSGAKIWRDAKTVEPTGVMTECWDWMFGGAANCPWSYEQLKGAITKTCREAVRFGVTSINELYKWKESMRVYQDLHRRGELPIRIRFNPTIYGYYKCLDLDCLVNLGMESGFGDDWLKLGGVKIFVDAQGHDEEGRVLEWNRLSKKKLDDLVTKSHKAGLRVMMHTMTRAGHKAALDAVEAALKELPRKDHRHRIEHFDRDWRPERERLKKLGILAVPTPYSPFGWYGDAWLDSARPGEKIVPYRTYLDEGLILPGNSDCVGTVPEALNPWWSIWCMVNRKTRSGRLICPEESVSVMEAIRIYTINSAYSCFEEKVKGSIEPGKLADLAVLRQDPLTIPHEKLKDVEVDMTIIDGNIAYRRGK
jgi:predicted amidohydrolase YtcJ